MVILSTAVPSLLVRRLLPVGSISTLFSFSCKLDVELSNASQKGGNVLVSSAKLLLVLSVLSFEVDQLSVGLQLDPLIG